MASQKKYNINQLIYFELFSDMYSAIAREKTIKGWLRKKKIDLVRTTNPPFADLSEDWYEQNLSIGRRDSSLRSE
jgi:putative endonuclease